MLPIVAPSLVKASRSSAAVNPPPSVIVTCCGLIGVSAGRKMALPAAGVLLGSTKDRLNGPVGRTMVLSGTVSALIAVMPPLPGPLTSAPATASVVPAKAWPVRPPTTTTSVELSIRRTSSGVGTPRKPGSARKRSWTLPPSARPLASETPVGIDVQARPSAEYCQAPCESGVVLPTTTTPASVFDSEPVGLMADRWLSTVSPKDGVNRLATVAVRGGVPVMVPPRVAPPVAVGASLTGVTVTPNLTSPELTAAVPPLLAPLTSTPAIACAPPERRVAPVVVPLTITSELSIRRTVSAGGAPLKLGSGRKLRRVAADRTSAFEAVRPLPITFQVVPPSVE